MNYSEAIEFLYRLQLFGTNLGLENSIELASRLGHPQSKLRFIHVAGTNGKGSSCAMLESAYRRAGYKTGLFTSPHLVSFTERIQVNRVCIPAPEVIRLTERIANSLGGTNPQTWPFHPTFFEFITIMALLFFAKESCEVVIWETGLGGRLDATNIVTPLASVITNIQLDHEKWLGNTLPAIAAEKAGIIKQGVPIITGTDDAAALEVIRAKAHELRAPLAVVSKSLRLAIPLIGEHQQRNAALVVETIQQLQGELPVSQQAVEEGLATTTWPGRLQLLNLSRGRVLLDGAHNPDGAATLVRALLDYFPNEEKTLVLGLFKDKPWQTMCETLLPQFERAFFVPIQSDRTLDPAEVKRYCDRHFPKVETAVISSLKAAIGLALTGRGGLVVITGSLHFVGEAMEALGVAPQVNSERGLNDWDAERHSQSV